MTINQTQSNNESNKNNNNNDNQKLKQNNDIETDDYIEPQIYKKYELLKKLGSGAYGHVWKVQDQQTKQIFALKKIYSAFHNQLDAERTYREISLLMKLDHPNIIKLKSVYRAINNIDLYLVFQFMETDLFKSIKGKFLTNIHKKYIVYQLVKTLKYLHSGGILHRDIKPSNILINSDCKIKLCDFGLSRTTFNHHPYIWKDQEIVITQFIATRWYRAPQVMLGSQFYNTKSDIWSLGCFIYQLYTSKILLQGQDNIDQIVKLVQFKGFPTQQQKKSFKIPNIDEILENYQIKQRDQSQYYFLIEDKKLKKLLQQIFQYDQNKRPSASQILESEFLQQLKGFEGQQSDKILKQKIKLQHSQNIKLSMQQYRDIIYNLYAQKINSQINIQLKKNDDQLQIQELDVQQQDNRNKLYKNSKLKNKKHFVKLIHVKSKQIINRISPKIFYVEGNVQLQKKKIVKNNQIKDKNNKKIIQRNIKYNSLHLNKNPSQIYEKQNLKLMGVKHKPNKSFYDVLKVKNQNGNELINNSIDIKKYVKNNASMYQKQNYTPQQQKNNNTQSILINKKQFNQSHINFNFLKQNKTKHNKSLLEYSPYKKKNQEKFTQQQKLKQSRSIITIKKYHFKNKSQNISPSKSPQKIPHKTAQQRILLRNQQKLENQIIQQKQVHQKIQKNSLKNLNDSQKKQNLNRKSFQKLMLIKQKLPQISPIAKILNYLVKPQKIIKKSKIKLNKGY